MIRSVRPTDLMALLAFEGKLARNEAVTRDRLGDNPERPLPMRTLLEQWITLESYRHTWIWTEGQAIRGLVSARQRAGRSAWEVDWLLSPCEPEASEALPVLFRGLCEDGVQGGMEKIFLRLPQMSLLVEEVRRAGFWPYTQEFLYRHLGSGEFRQEGPASGVEGLRPRHRVDSHQLFRLYNAAVPELVRKAEGTTLREWSESREQTPSGARRRDLIWEQGGDLLAWIRIVPQGSGGQFHLLVHPSAEEQMERLLFDVLGRFKGEGPIYCLVPEYQPRLRRVLAGEALFEEMDSYFVMVKQLAVRVSEPRPAPARVSEVGWP